VLDQTHISPFSRQQLRQLHSIDPVHKSVVEIKSVRLKWNLGNREIVIAAGAGASVKLWSPERVTEMHMQILRGGHGRLWLISPSYFPYTQDTGTISIHRMSDKRHENSRGKTEL
jgi:hypothetical protein